MKRAVYTAIVLIVLYAELLLLGAISVNVLRDVLPALGLNGWLVMLP